MTELKPISIDLAGQRCLITGAAGTYVDFVSKRLDFVLKVLRFCIENVGFCRRDRSNARDDVDPLQCFCDCG